MRLDEETDEKISWKPPVGTSRRLWGWSQSLKFREHPPAGQPGDDMNKHGQHGSSSSHEWRQEVGVATSGFSPLILSTQPAQTVRNEGTDWWLVDQGHTWHQLWSSLSLEHSGNCDPRWCWGGRWPIVGDSTPSSISIKRREIKFILLVSVFILSTSRGRGVAVCVSLTLANGRSNVLLFLLGQFTE